MIRRPSKSTLTATLFPYTTLFRSNGAIGIVATELGGNIETVNGDITVGIDSHVRGGLQVHKQNSTWLPIQFGSHHKPRIVIGPNEVVEGDQVFELEDTRYVHSSARTGNVTGATPRAVDTPPQR